MQELKTELEEIKADSKVKDKYIKKLVNELEHLQNNTNSIKEESIFKSMSIKVMSTQVNTLVDEVSTRDDIRGKYMDMQTKYQNSAKEKQTLDQQFKSSSEDIRL